MNASASAALVRWWVKAYTRGLPEQLRTARRDEVDDDLWCQQEEAVATGRSARSVGAEMFVRFVLGVPADLSWRFGQARHARASAPVRSSSMSTRVIGTLAVLAGMSWTAMMMFYVALGESAWVGPSALFMMVSVVGGGLAFAATACGLLWRFQERLHYLGGVGGSAAALGAVAGAINGAWALTLLPIGSAALALDLARIGVLSLRVATLHALCAGGLLIVLIAAYTGGGGDSAMGIAALAILYPVTWIAIGASLLRGVPRIAGERLG